MHRTILNTTKQQWMTIGIVLLAVIVVYYVFLRKKKAESNYSDGRGFLRLKPSASQNKASTCPCPPGQECVPGTTNCRPSSTSSSNKPNCIPGSVWTGNGCSPTILASKGSINY